MDHVHRIAIVSSPRSGNSWIRTVMAKSLEMQEVAVHNYVDVPQPLPERCFLQIHWYREPNFQRWLQDNGFRVMCVARHPLDVLLSVLHFGRFEPETARWLEGNAQIPDELALASPTSEVFLRYALGFGAESLLSISHQWWHEESAVKVRYEDCVRNPESVIGGLVQSFGGDALAVAPWLDRFRLDHWKALPNRHGWQGAPGLFRRLIRPVHARVIFHRHLGVFNTLGYEVQPYVLSARAAERNWKLLR